MPRLKRSSGLRSADGEHHLRVAGEEGGDHAGDREQLARTTAPRQAGPNSHGMSTGRRRSAAEQRQHQRRVQARGALVERRSSSGSLVRAYTGKASRSMMPLIFS